LAKKELLAPPSVRLHRGDIMSPETRSRVMSRIRGKNTKPELAVAEILRACRLDFDSHARDLPGRPDFVLRERRVAIFCDGDFWHGWRFPLWRLKLSEKWERKIEANRRRDARNHRALRAKGFTVVRLWEHQIENSADACAERIMRACLLLEVAAEGR
jgi:DNA mismatch endonuclease (patch repair protein)